LQKVKAVAVHGTDVHLSHSNDFTVLFVDEAEDSIFQFGSGLLGKGERDDVSRLDTWLTEYIGDPLRNHLCLTGSGACDDLQRLVEAADCLSLSLCVVRHGSYRAAVADWQ
jgi:hypothetical protein